MAGCALNGGGRRGAVRHESHPPRRRRREPTSLHEGTPIMMMRQRLWGGEAHAE
ncbi:hypothetical protein DB31_5760 [Hyalangium minutum]|uniref:Uncharacterized protein n=1 Tax=Hyalangium minutum TaxID=394096 RepID=A0A085WSQ5_9BACT|nr:hypothetical protein DB31_5760 [Hyalangium minutum]